MVIRIAAYAISLLKRAITEIAPRAKIYMASQAVGFMLTIHDIEKRYSHAMLEPEIVKKENSDKKEHKYPENDFFSEKFVDEYNQD